MRSWVEMYDECDIATKKMIVAHIMRTVKVRRDYEIEIDLTIDCEEFGKAARGAKNADCCGQF